MLEPGVRAGLADRIAERAFGLGPLEPLLADPLVEEVMVNGTEPVWVERGGPAAAHRGPLRAARRKLREAIERILAPLGRRVDEAEPLCDARLPDGSRINVVIPPLALDGPVLTIRRFRRRGFTGAELVANGTLTEPLLEFLGRAVRARCTILVCGGTGSGKTTTLNALSAFIGEGERVVTIEDAAELRLRQPHVDPAGGAAAEPRGPRRGHDPPARAQRAAHAARPDRRRRGARGRGARSADRALDRARRLALHRPRRQPGRGAPPDRDARADGRPRPAACGAARAGRRRLRPRGLPVPGADGTRRVTAVAEVVRVAGGPAARELYGWREAAAAGAPPSEHELAARLAEAP